MLPVPSSHRPLLALVCVAGLLCPSGTMAQGLGLDLGGRGSVDLGGGGDSRLDLGVELGGSGGGLRLSLDAVGPPLGQKAALQAVRKRQALPLEDILLRAKRLTDGEVIDAQLVSLQDVLLYEIKVLGTSGDVSELFFLARTGEFLDLN